MGIKVVTNGKIRDSDDVDFAERAIDLKNAGKTWEAIDLLVEAWAKRAPDEVRATKMVIQGYRNSLLDRKYGQTSGGKDMERRFVLSMPQALRIMIGALFKRDLVVDNKFYVEFGRRYPFFMVAEKT